MNPSPRLLRRAANMVLHHAASVLPSRHAVWADAMRNELPHIAGDGEALRWALGCLLASYLERLRIPPVIQSLWFRIALGVVILGRAVDLLFATLLTLAYRAHWLGLARFLGAFTPGGDYRRLVPLLDSTPWYVHALWLGGAMLSLVAAGQLLRNRATAFLTFAAGCALGAAGEIIGQRLPEFRAVFASTPQQVFRDNLASTVRIAALVLVGVALWIHRRCIRTLAAD